MLLSVRMAENTAYIPRGIPDFTSNRINVRMRRRRTHYNIDDGNI